MSDHVVMREPFKSYFKTLDDFAVRAGRIGDNNVVVMGDSIFRQIGLPNLDQEDAEALAVELRAAVMPVIERFRAKKLKEFMNTTPTNPGLL